MSILKTTMIYAHPSPENKRKAVEVLAAVFGGGSDKIQAEYQTQNSSVSVSSNN